MADETLEEFKRRTGASAAPGGDDASGGESLDDFRRRTGAVAKPPATTTATTQAPAFKLPSRSLADIITSPEAQAADMPQSQAPAAQPFSLEALRDKIQQADMAQINALKPGPDAGPAERFMRQAAAMPGHLVAGLAQLPVNALIGLSQGPSGAVTINPETGTLGLTPEASTAAQLLAGSGFGGRDVQFSGANPLMREPPGTFTRPPPTTLDELTAAVRRADQMPARPGGVSGPTEGGGEPQPGMGAAQPIAETVEPVLTAEERAWAAGAQEKLQEIKAANQAAGIPGDLGAAATPEQLAQLTPQQMKAYRRQAELGEALAPAPREMDRKIYVEGSKPTRAEYSADPEVSQQERLERERAPKQHDAVQEENNTARVRKFENMMGTDIQVDDLKVAKAKAAETDGNEFLRVARPIDLKPAADWIDGQLADPRVQARPDVVKKLGDLRKSLFDADGNMRTEPGYGWGLHDEVMADLEKAKDTTRAERYSKSQLLQWKKIIDGVNDNASDGAFQRFLDNQSDYAARINALELLQKYRPKLTSGKTGMILPTAYHRFVADLAMRRGNPGIDAAMDVPDEVMRGLLNIGKDLKRADNIDLGAARGSPTNLMFSLAKGMGIGMAHLGFTAASHGTGIGNLLLQSAMKAGETATGNILLRRRVNRSLAPPPGGYDYSPVQENPLSGPP